MIDQHSPIQYSWVNANMPALREKMPHPLLETSYFAELIFGDGHPGDLPVSPDAPITVMLAISRKMEIN